MPSTDAPTHYERADGIASGRTDQFFKWLDEDQAHATCGDVESPLGFIMLLEITRQDISVWVSSQGDPWMSEARNFAPGWYITRTDSNGLIWAMSYGEDCVYNEQRARADYAECEAVDTAWQELES